MRIKQDGDADGFWKRIEDMIYGKSSFSMLAERADVNYRTLANQHSSRRIPEATTILKLSRALGVSIEYLLTGQYEVHHLPQRIELIAQKLTRISESNLETIETMIMALPDEESKKIAIPG